MQSTRRPAPLPVLPARACADCGATFRATDEEHRRCSKCHSRGRVYLWKRHEYKRRIGGVQAGD